MIREKVGEVLARVQVHPLTIHPTHPITGKELPLCKPWSACFPHPEGAHAGGNSTAGFLPGVFCRALPCGLGGTGLRRQPVHPPGARLILMNCPEELFTGTLLNMGRVTGCRAVAVVAASSTVENSRIYAGITGKR